MTAAAESRLSRISIVMQIVCLTLLAGLLLVAAYALLAVAAEPERLTRLFPGMRFDPQAIGALRLAAIAAVAMVSVLLVARALYLLSQMFGAFRHGDMLSARTTSLMRRAGLYFLAAAIWGTVADAMTSVLLTWSNAEGQRQLSVGLSGDDIFPLILAGVLFAIGHVLAIAAEIDAENKSFV